MTQQTGIAVKTGTNQGIPIIHYLNFHQSNLKELSKGPLISDDYIVLAYQAQAQGEPDGDQEILRLTSLALKLEPSYEAYELRGYAFGRLGNYKQSIANSTKAIEIRPHTEAQPYMNRGIARYYLGDYNLSAQDYSRLLKQILNIPHIL